MNTQPTLEQRIVDALQPDATVTSADVAALIDEAEAGIAKAEKEATVDRSLTPFSQMPPLRRLMWQR